MAATNTWVGDFDGNYNDAQNWSGDNGPPTVTGIFATSAATNIVFSHTNTSVGLWTFNSGADAFDFVLLLGGTFGFLGGGIANASSNLQTLSNRGTVNFEGASTIFGDVHIENNGFLRFFGTSSAGTVDIENNAFLQFNDSSSAGSSTVTIGTGATVQFLDNSNGGNATFDALGGTVDFSGTQFANLAAGSIAGSGNFILGDNQLTVFDGNDLLVSGVISGNGSLVLDDGILNLTGANTYAGGTTINSDGVLDIGNGGTTGEIAGNVVDNGLLQFNRSNAYQFDGVISGSGDVEQNGGGTTTLTAANTFTGNTFVGAGILALGATGSIANSSVVNVGALGTFNISATDGASIVDLAGSGNVVLGGETLTLTAASSSTSFSGIIQGAGGLTITGGNETLSGINTYGGNTTINGGTLLVEGSIADSSTTIANGGTLGGGGVTGEVLVQSGGTLAPGASTDVLFTDSIIFQSGATFSVEFDGIAAGTGYDQLNVTGVVVLGGATLAATLGFAPATGDQFIIIDNSGTADPVQGTFAGLAQGAELQIGNRFFQINYQGGDGNDVVLTTQGAIINGNSAANIINGSSSVGSQPFATNFRDVISGNGGNDKISGLGGDDTLNGGSADDTLRGGSGNDTLTGARGRDLQYGDSGRDVFDFNSIKDSVVGGRRDKINDFKRGQDHIDLKDIDARSGSGNQKFEWIGKKDFSDEKGELRYKDNGSKVIVQGDTNGDGKADFEIFVSVGSLSRGDFVL